MLPIPSSCLPFIKSHRFASYSPTSGTSTAASSFIINTIAGNFATYGVNGGFAGDGGIPQSAGLFWPAGLVQDSSGNLYFPDLWNNRIRCINNQATTQTLFNVSVGAGHIQTIAGASSTNGFAGDGGQATNASVRMGHPVNVVLDGAGNLYFCDQQNAAIRRITPAGVLSTVVGGTNTNFFPGDNVPISFALSACGTASAGNTTYTGVFSPVPTAGTWIYVQGFATAANNGRFQAQAGGNANTLILNNASGAAETHAATANYATLAFPQGLWINSAGTLLYVADSNNNVIRVANLDTVSHTTFGVTVAANQIATIAGTSTTAPANAGYSGDGGVATSAKLNQPLGIWIDGNGTLYIAEDYNNVIRKVTSAGVISTIAGGTISTVSISAVTHSGSNNTYTYTLSSGPALRASGSNNISYAYISGCTTAANNGAFQITSLGSGTFAVTNASGVTEAESGATAISPASGYSGDGGVATSALLNQPFDVKTDKFGSVLIAESGNFLVRRIINGTINTIAGTGVGGYTGDGNVSTSAEMGDPSAAPEGIIGPVSILPTGSNILVADTGNNLIRELYPNPVAAPTVLSISPNSGGQNGGTAVTITGTGFMLNATVTIGGAAATSVVVISPTTITCITGAVSPSTVNVTVTNATGQSGTLTNGYTYNVASPGFVSSGVSGATSGNNPVTINTTGATLLVAVLSAGGSAAGTITDSVGGLQNAWNYVETTAASGTNVTRIAYAYAASGGGPLNTGASHTFTPAGTTPSIAVYAFNNTLTTASVFDAGTFTSGAASSALQAGSITPAANDCVVVGFGSNNSTISGVSVDSSFTGVLNIANGNVFEIVAGAYLVNASGSAINPKFTATTGNSNNVVIAAFK